MARYSEEVGFRGLVVALGLVTACSPANEPAVSASSAPAPRVMTASSSAAAPASAPAAASASAASAPPAPPSVSEQRALEILFPGGAPASCAGSSSKIRCFIGARYEEHPKEKDLALALFDEIGDVAGTEKEHRMEGGFRGVIHIVPELPVGPHERHLRWVLGAQRDIRSFVKAIEAKAKTPVRYRHGALAWRFLRSVGRTTPSAYAGGWEVGYNVKGSLHGSADAVRETIFHEVFHLNDQEHQNWSRRALGKMVDELMEKCGTKVACLKPYAPGKTMVRGGTYYAFQPDNGDASHEYGAELATRYFLEHRAVLDGKAYPDGRFKCGPEENKRAWKALAEEFFGGVDLVPPCDG
jgi:hypothetical protein